MAIEVYLLTDVLITPYGQDVSNIVQAKNTIQGKALMSPVCGWK